MKRTQWIWALGATATAALAYAGYKVWQRSQYKAIIEEGSFTIKIKK